MTVHPITAGYAKSFAALRAALPGADLPWLDGLRGVAIGRFAEKGLPTPRLESWKFTNLRPVSEKIFEPALPARALPTPADFPAVAPFAAHSAARVVFVNGHYRPDLSQTAHLPTGVAVVSLAEAVAERPEFVHALLPAPMENTPALSALNLAFVADGTVVHVPAGMTLEAPIELVYLAAPGRPDAVTHPRNLIVADAESRLELIEVYAGANGREYWTNAVTQIAVQRNASVRHLKVQAEGDRATHVSTADIRLAQGSRYSNFLLAGGAALARHEINAALDGNGIELDLNGLLLGRGRQHLDATTTIDHNRPGSASREHYRGVFDDHAHGVFQGCIVVRPDAQKTEAHQLNRNLLLSATAHADTKPELRIFADDVKCSHGAAVGDIDREALFFLRARGIGRDEARRLLILGFVEALLDDQPVEAAKERASDWVRNWLATPNAGGSA